MTTISTINNNNVNISQLAHPVGIDLTDPTGRSIEPLPGIVAYDKTTNLHYVGTDAAEWQLLKSGNSGNGDVVGPTSSTDEAIARYDGTTGKLIQNSVVLISDTGAITGVTTINGGTISGINTGDVTLAPIGASPNANGASLAGQVLNLQPASASFGGVVTTGAQSFAGIKTFSSGIRLSTSITTLNNYSKDTIAGTYSGAVASTSTNFTLERIGNLVFMTMPKIYEAKATAGAGATITVSWDTGIPPQYLPAVDTFGTINVYASVSPFAAANQEYSMGIFQMTTLGAFNVAVSIMTTTDVFVLFADAGSGAYNGVPAQTIYWAV